MIHVGQHRLLFLAVVMVIASCTFDLSAQEAEVFITRDGRIVFESAPTSVGETIFTIENNHAEPHQLVLARLEGIGPDELPVDPSTGMVPTGRPSDLRYQGPGYMVTNKMEDMRPYFGSGERITLTLHTYLEAGTYILFGNLPSSYQAGLVATFEITEGDA